MNLGFCRYAGKGQGEVSLPRRLWGALAPGDVLLADRLTANWATIHMLRARGSELVSRLNEARRRADFRRGRRLGPDDRVVRWPEPTSIRSLDRAAYRAAYRALPDAVTVREARVRVARPGSRTKSVVAVATLLDPRQATKEELAGPYRARWRAEPDPRAIKAAMPMAELRGKTPETARKEAWAHVLAYNRIRTVTARAAAAHDLAPRSISFTGAMQTRAAFQPLLAPGAAGAADRARVYRDVLAAVAAHRAGGRPDRHDPRAKERRKDYRGWLTRPRAELKGKMAKGSNKK